MGLGLGDVDDIAVERNDMDDEISTTQGRTGFVATLERLSLGSVIEEKRG